MTFSERNQTKAQLIEELEALRKRVETLRRVEGQREKQEGDIVLLRAALESSGDGILILDENKRVIYDNRRFQEVWRLPEGWHTPCTQRLSLLQSRVKHPEKLARRIKEIDAQPDVEAYDIIEMRDGRVIERYAIPYRVDGAIKGRVWNVRDITDRRRAEFELRKSQEQLKAIFDNATAGIVLVDTTGHYFQINERWLKMLGYPSQRALRMTFLDHTHPDDIERSSALMQALIHGEIDAYQLEKRYIRQGGGIFWASVSVAPIRDKDGQVQAVVGVVVDITERKLIAQERERLIAELDSYSHTVAHDLKSPLGLVQGFAGLLQEERGALPEDQVDKYLSIIFKNSKKAVNIIDELLLLAHVRQTEIHAQAIDMAGVVDSAFQRLSYMIEEKGAQVTLPSEWPAALGYEPWIEEIWINYISNAIKYGGNPPRLELGAEKLRSGAVKFWLSDNGAGISEEDQQKLFMPFMQISRTTATKGHGLGLSIVQRIAEKLGGSVGVESEVGAGSTFYFTLRAAPKE